MQMNFTYIIQRSEIGFMLLTCYTWKILSWNAITLSVQSIPQTKHDERQSKWFFIHVDNFAVLADAYGTVDYGELTNSNNFLHYRLVSLTESLYDGLHDDDDDDDDDDDANFYSRQVVYAITTHQHLIDE